MAAEEEGKKDILTLATLTGWFWKSLLAEEWGLVYRCRRRIRKLQPAPWDLPSTQYTVHIVKWPFRSFSNNRTDAKNEKHSRVSWRWLKLTEKSGQSRELLPSCTESGS